MKDPKDMHLFELAELLRRDKAAGLKELTLRFRRAAKEASEQSHALGLHVFDGRAGEPLPPEENWEGTPVGQDKRLRKPLSIEAMPQGMLDQAVEDDDRSKSS